MDEGTQNSWPVIHAREASPGHMVRDKRIERILLTTDGSYPELRVILEDLSTATMGHDALIQHKDICWIGYVIKPENEWDRANSGSQPKACPGCRVDDSDNHLGEKIWIFREGSTRIVSTGGDSFDLYYCGVWECTNCGYQTLPKPVHDHPKNT